ncbi:hypothetical protein LEP1GSC082_2375 [Leptospira kirschneri str. H2]|uniref:Uncharacterized protein n=2 Tax=Leptospira kirschneri TaxID=29507 RepID=A0A0E2AXZ7_9LEPT|nr:hypothetical protein LEP1GSC081_3142 [Leptospira kirschneri str. H1]EKO61421.1 hypothetical protein LEP1GSC082_2375 [Leptospira kirschneri str. H2]EMJ95555.1 hypothetical protein LEP1GSC198_1146 [Leptospira kirschneri str. JB]EMK06834.1 hypothetical protein LEP1GSC166_1072 [Leptospira kirschneri]EMK24246.1 hypothetical protein LEP1GSC008_3646 [Leptospira kirschneri serovar Bulgarica str. Nikolaevo]
MTAFASLRSLALAILYEIKKKDRPIKFLYEIAVLTTKIQ